MKRKSTRWHCRINSVRTVRALTCGKAVAPSASLIAAVVSGFGLAVEVMGIGSGAEELGLAPDRLGVGCSFAGIAGLGVD